MGDFLEQDTIKLATFNDLLLNKLQSHGFVARGTSLDTSNKYVFFSYERKGPVPNFSVYFTAVENAGSVSLEFECYCNVLKVTHPFLKSIQCWSQLDELIRFVLSSTENSSEKKVNFINNSIDLLNTPKFNHFAHFRMSAGSNYYITAEDVAHTHATDRAQLMLETEPDNVYITPMIMFVITVISLYLIQSFSSWMTSQRLSLACLVTRRCLCFLLEVTSLLNIPISREIHHKCLWKFANLQTH
ncbi:hypothetical protein PoB_006771600 [Plakobranchus ocellatus]|uniref:Uncharacterized protein n=1 Tax=Plakobranchus ocellatus TaxID=259542 RepID=A0AAV4DAW6_9GAST|nr:hypothetical protein PoB_006771600 [Plakobranchus ocellatus]